MESLRPLQTLADFQDALSAARTDYNHSSANVVTNKKHIRNSRKMAFRSSFVTKFNNTGRSEPADTKKQLEVGQDVAASNDRESEECHIQIFVSNPVREILCLQLHPSTTISDLKELLQEELNIQAKTQHLVTKKGIELCDTQSLKVLGIQQDTNLELRQVAGLMGGTRKRKSAKGKKCKSAKKQDQPETETSSTVPGDPGSTCTGTGAIPENPKGSKEHARLQSQEESETYQSTSAEKQAYLVQSQRFCTGAGAIPKNPRGTKEQTRLQSQDKPATPQNASTKKQDHLVLSQRPSTGTGVIPKNQRGTKEQMELKSQEEPVIPQNASPEKQDHLVLSQRPSTGTGAIPKNQRGTKEQIQLKPQEEPVTPQSASPEKKDHLVQSQRFCTGAGAIPKNPRGTKEQMELKSQEEPVIPQSASPEKQDHLVQSQRFCTGAVAIPKNPRGTKEQMELKSQEEPVTPQSASPEKQDHLFLSQIPSTGTGAIPKNQRGMKEQMELQSQEETENYQSASPEKQDHLVLSQRPSTGTGAIPKNQRGTEEQMELQSQEEPATPQSASPEKQANLVLSQRPSTGTGAIPKNQRRMKEQMEHQSQEEPAFPQSASPEKQDHLVLSQRPSTGTGAIPKNQRGTKEQIQLKPQVEPVTHQIAFPEKQDHLVCMPEEPKAHQSVSSAAGTTNEIASNCGGKDIVPALHQDLAMRSQSSDVHTFAHHQSHVEEMSIGERSTVFMSHASGITINQTFNQNVYVSVPGTPELNHQAQTIADEAKETFKKTHRTTAGAPDPNHQAQAVADQAKEALKQVYTTMTTGTPNPNHQAQAVAEEANEALKEVYMTTGSFVQMLPWVDDDKIHIMDIYTKLVLVELVDEVGRIVKESKRMESYEDVFHLKTIERIPIKRVVISGSAGVGKTTLIDKIAYDWAMDKSEILKRFELIFVLKMRALKQSSDLIDAIFHQLLDQDSVNKSVLKEFIDKNQDRVLILLDGFDEFQTTTLNESSFGSILKVLNRKQGRKCWVLITSRPPLDKLVSSSMVEKPFTHVKVEGFSGTDIQKYVNKFFPEDHDKVGQLMEKIQSSEVLSDLAKSPMMLLLMCLLWREYGKLPDTMTRLYTEALKYIFKRKSKDLSQDAISNILISIGKVALCGLISTNQALSFKEEDFDKEGFNAALSAGVLTSERVFKGLDTHNNVYFIHKTFLEFCAAKYWQSLTNTKDFESILVQVCSATETFPSPYENLLRFCCGDNEECTNRILRNLKNKDPRMGLICYFESQSESLPSEDFINAVVRTEIKINMWNSDCINSFFYFLKHVADQTRIQGSAYLSIVKHFFITKCDLAYCLTKLPNIYVLSLSQNGIFDGCVSFLAPLKRMKHLKELQLTYCKLTGGDIGPIGEALSNLPTMVDLDLSGNCTLGGCASLWAPYLKRMKHLKELKLTYCNLTGGDIGHIAEALSDLPTIVDLDLSGNYTLGGCASLWAPYLKRMKHLKKLNLTRCKLTGEDEGPIAEAMSHLPNIAEAMSHLPNIARSTDCAYHHHHQTS